MKNRVAYKKNVYSRDIHDEVHLWILIHEPFGNKSNDLTKGSCIDPLVDLVKISREYRQQCLTYQTDQLLYRVIKAIAPPP